MRNIPLRNFGTLCLLYLLMAGLTASRPAAAEVFSKQYKVRCLGKEHGCPCYKKPSKAAPAEHRLLHLQAVTGVSGKDETLGKGRFTALRTQTSARCYYPTRQLKPIYWSSSRCPDTDAFRHLPFPAIDTILAQGAKSGPKSPALRVFPTFYYVADEAFYSGAANTKLYETKTGRLLATVDKDFRKDLDIQGTGRLRDGRVLNVGTYRKGVWDYVVLPAGSYGLGVAGHYLYPFRTAAVDFSYLCKKAGLAGCSGQRRRDAAALAGSLLYIPQLAGAALPNGQTHDGYVCANDVGGAIKADRIDLFVGTMGGGNPYLPACRAENAYTRHGIESLVPYDWRLFNKKGRLRPREYRRTVPHKALDVYVIQGAKCKQRWDP